MKPSKRKGKPLDAVAANSVSRFISTKTAPPGSPPGGTMLSEEDSAKRIRDWARSVTKGGVSVPSR